MPSLETIAGLIGLFLTGVGLIYTGRQIQESRKIARGEFLLHLDELFQQHNDYSGPLCQDQKSTKIRTQVT